MGELGHHARGHASHGAIDAGRVQQLLVLLSVGELGVSIRRETVPGTLGGDEDRRATGSNQRLDERENKEEKNSLQFCVELRFFCSDKGLQIERRKIRLPFRLRDKKRILPTPGKY